MKKTRSNEQNKYLIPVAVITLSIIFVTAILYIVLRAKKSVSQQDRFVNGVDSFRELPNKNFESISEPENTPNDLSNDSLEDLDVMINTLTTNSEDIDYIDEFLEAQ